MMWRWMAAGTGLVTITIGLVAIVTADSEAERDRGGTAAAQPGVEAAAEPGAKGAFEKRSSAKPRRGKRIITGGSQFGRMLFDRKRQAIYVFDKEKGKRSRCYGRCAKEWPPVLTKRRNGSRQVTYAGAPLYYYAHEKPRQVLCHNVISFGGLWQVVGPGGAPRD
jgi:predicted lipoprotein with Yx(FWY)xxD motif